MFHVKHTIAVIMAVCAVAAHAQSSAQHGHRAGVSIGARGALGHAAAASSGGANASANGAAQSGSNGGAYSSASMMDNYQPWPQSEMQQFAKPCFVPYGSTRACTDAAGFP